MNINKIVLSLIAVTLISFGIAGLLLESPLSALEGNDILNTYEINEEKTFSMEDVTELEIAAVSTDVNFIPTDSTDIRVVFHGTVKSNSDAALPKMVSDRSGQNINIEIKHTKRLFSFVNPERLYLDIYVPKNYDQKITLAQVSGDAEIKDLQLRSIEFALVSGNLLVENLTAEMGIVSVSGDVILRNIKGDIVAATVSGDIDADFTNIEHEIEFNSVSGNVDMKIPEDSCFDLYFESKSGKLDTEFPLSSSKFKIVEQSGEVTKISNEQQCDDIAEIYVNTVSGDLDIGY